MAFFQIPDVAKKAGVPESTVMLVIGNVKDIETGIKMKVFNAMKEVSYIANKADINTTAKNPGVIAVFSSVFFYFFVPVAGIVRDRTKIKTDKF